MRTKNELVQIVLDNLEYYIETYRNRGLCSIINGLCSDESISEVEKEFLYDLINKNIKEYSIFGIFSPNYKSSLFFREYEGYFWYPGLIRPRKRYLKYLLTI